LELAEGFEPPTL